MPYTLIIEIPQIIGHRNMKRFFEIRPLTTQNVSEGKKN